MGLNFSMNRTTWEHHSHPLSVWSRVLTGWLIFPAIWSHSSWGWTLAGIFILTFAFWMYLNPRVFPKPRQTGSWASQVTFGERVWLKEVPFDGLEEILEMHRMPARLLAILAGIGFIGGAITAAFNLFWPTMFFALAMIVGKLWFCDRMVWLFNDATDAHPELANWVY
ncbi:hypothetical protein O4H49_07945 [Kiloniella laminariae]|uniref:Uncharacterized protein n=1 Tax=Kiloniella laminariae TaxID=454162 RepID=A0ABT4LHY2_9PROT|nr:DUF6653 family protein [Kiloniella laminariae]MCZ4280706.1 hypothetical protein [Kiloniella laminariae]